MKQIITVITCNGCEAKVQEGEYAQFEQTGILNELNIKEQEIHFCKKCLTEMGLIEETK